MGEQSKIQWPFPVPEGFVWHQPEAPYLAHESARIESGAWIGARARIGEEARIGTEAQIGARARIEKRAWIGAHAEIGTHAQIGPETYIGGCTYIGEYAHLRSHTQIGPRTWVGTHACIGERARIGACGEGYAHVMVGSYPADIYRDADGVVWLRYGRVTYTMSAWTQERIIELCHNHEPERADYYIRRLTALVQAAPMLLGEEADNEQAPRRSEIGGGAGVMDRAWCCRMPSIYRAPQPRFPRPRPDRPRWRARWLDAP